VKGGEQHSALRKLDRQRQDYLESLLECLELEQERYEWVGAWNFSHDIVGGVEKVENLHNEYVNGPNL
jgi:hypothetical protein